ncbi:MAG: hypothetical protein H9882_01910 [Candidatus Fournierella pullistercoris]|uniref:Uncharacterized protein n=1 Tax=Candidatus Allofournierella pullistercoris TaxID=2838597 RepID=A0A948WRD5_9FIRM|nr:hypothetical protein [Candidatus Fournierella pullistercoris]
MLVDIQPHMSVESFMEYISD